MTDKVVIYTNGSQDLTKEIKAAIKGSATLSVDGRLIEELRLGLGEQDISLIFEDGTMTTEAFLVHKPKTELNGPFARQLKLELTEDGDIKASPPFQMTSMKGVHSAGDCATKAKAVVPALHMGTFAGIGLAHSLQAEPGYKL